jgi:hypothetical protein
MPETAFCYFHNTPIMQLKTAVFNDHNISVSSWDSHQNGVGTDKAAPVLN